MDRDLGPRDHAHPQALLDRRHPAHEFVHPQLAVLRGGEAGQPRVGTHEAREGVGDEQAEAQARVAGVQQRERRADQRVGDEGQRQGELALGLAAGGVEGLAGAADGGDGVAAAGEELLALAGEGGRPRAADQQGEAELVLEREHGLAHRRRADAELGRGAAEAAGLGDGDEGDDAAKQVGLHASTSG